MRSTDLTREQLERLGQAVKRHRRYYEQLWKRSQANDMPLADPFVEHVCRVWEHVNAMANMVERLKSAAPRPHRPLARTGKSSGLAWREMPWAEQQRLMMGQVRREAKKPKTPRPEAREEPD